MRTFTKGFAASVGINRGGFLWLGGLAACAAFAGGCLTKEAPRQQFYDQHVQPILKTFCVGNTSPCHSLDSNDPVTATALGNLDLTSFEGIQKRRDVLRTYGSYPHPLLLLKALPEDAVAINYLAVPGCTTCPTQYPSEIRHAGGKPIQASSAAYFELKRWLENGANRDGIAPAEVAKTGVGPCSTALPPASRQVPVDDTTPGYQTFVSTIQPLLKNSCTFGTCHSSPQADFYLTCGDDDPEQLKFNYGQAAGFVSPLPLPVEQSEI